MKISNNYLKLKNIHIFFSLLVFGMRLSYFRNYKCCSIKTTIYSTGTTASDFHDFNEEETQDENDYVAIV